MKCIADGCEREAVCKNACDKHYRRILRHGDINHTKPDRSAKSRMCPVCGTTFVPKHLNHKAKYCSKRCVWVATKGPEFNARIGREYAQKIGEVQRGAGEGRAYRKYMGRHEHRVVAEKMLGRPLRPGEVVHHRDGNKLNNAPENLLITTQGEHMKEHGLGIPGMKLWWKPWEGRHTKNAVHV